MKSLLFPVLLASLAATSATAQDKIRLQFEFLKNGSVVARPLLTVQDKETGTLWLENEAKLSCTASHVDAEKLAVAFEVTVGEKKVTPRITLRRDEHGSISWTNARGADAFELRMSWIR